VLMLVELWHRTIPCRLIRFLVSLVFAVVQIYLLLKNSENVSPRIPCTTFCVKARLESLEPQLQPDG
jgi:hypothetical protein